MSPDDSYIDPGSRTIYFLMMSNIDHAYYRC